MQEIAPSKISQREIAVTQVPIETIIKEKSSLPFDRKIIIFLWAIIIFLLILVGSMRSRSNTPLPNDNFLDSSPDTSHRDFIDYSTNSYYSNSINPTDNPSNSTDYSNSSTDYPDNPPTLLPSSSPSPPINSPDLPSSNSSTRPATSPNTPTY